MTKLSTLHLVGLPKHSSFVHLNDVFYPPLCLTKEKVLAYDAKNKSNRENQNNNTNDNSLSEISFDTKVKLKYLYELTKLQAGFNRQFFIDFKSEIFYELNKLKQVLFFLNEIMSYQQEDNVVVNLEKRFNDRLARKSLNSNSSSSVINDYFLNSYPFYLEKAKFIENYIKNIINDEQAEFEFNEEIVAELIELISFCLKNISKYLNSGRNDNEQDIDFNPLEQYCNNFTGYDLVCQFIKDEFNIDLSDKRKFHKCECIPNFSNDLRKLFIVEQDETTNDYVVYLNSVNCGKIKIKNIGATSVVADKIFNLIKENKTYLIEKTKVEQICSYYIDLFCEYIVYVFQRDFIYSNNYKYGEVDANKLREMIANLNNQLFSILKINNSNNNMSIYDCFVEQFGDAVTHSSVFFNYMNNDLQKISIDGKKVTYESTGSIDENDAASLYDVDYNSLTTTDIDVIEHIGDCVNFPTTCELCLKESKFFFDTRMWADQYVGHYCFY